MTFSEREREYTFAKNWIPVSNTCRDLCLLLAYLN